LSRRLAPAIAGIALLLSACGGVDPDERDADFATYTPEEVQKRFQDLTGVELEPTVLRGDALTALRPEIDSTDNPGYRRYSGVSVYVTGNEDALNSVEERSGARRQRRFDNVVVQGTSSGDRGEAAYARMVRVMASLGKPAGQAMLAPADTLCDRQGIDPEGGDGKAGRCVDGEQRAVTIVNSGDDLELDDATISDVEVSTGTRLRTSRFGGADTMRATGRYVVVGYELLNTGDRPITSVRPGLVIDGKHFSEDTRAGFEVRARDVFPLQPGAGGRAVAVFDLPDASADDYDEGALEFPVGLNGIGSSIDLSEEVGRVRLEGAEQGPKRFGTTRLSG